MTHLREMMKLYRSHHHLSTRKHAKSMGVSHATLYRFEQGRAKITAETLAGMICWMLSKPPHRRAALSHK